MQKRSLRLTTSEAAFLAGLTDKQLHRVVDENVLPESLFERTQDRRFAPIASVFAAFYFGTNNDLTKAVRLSVIETLMKRFMGRRDARDVVNLRFASALDWAVPASFGLVDLSEFVRAVVDRATNLERATTNVTVNSNIMGGLPVFAGTRLPIDTVASAKMAGASDHLIIATYPFLTTELIRDAEIYQQAHPRRGRPRSLGELNPSWILLERKTVRRAKTE